MGVNGEEVVERVHHGRQVHRGERGALRGFRLDFFGEDPVEQLRENGADFVGELRAGLGRGLHRVAEQVQQRRQRRRAWRLNGRLNGNFVERFYHLETEEGKRRR